MMDLALAIEKLVPAAEYSGSTNGNDDTAFAALIWDDIRPKPSWEDVVTADAIPPPSAPPHLNNGGLARFSGAAPVNVFENIRLGAVTRVTKGRWRTALIEAIPQGYSPIVGYIDAAVRNVRVSACTATYVEVKATDAAGAAADCEQIIVKIERVIS